MAKGSAYFEEVLNRLPSALISVSPDFDVIWRNASAENLIPMAVPGSNLYEVLRPAASEEKLDRFLLRGEKVMFRAEPELPLLEWLLSEETLPGGDLILMAWDPDITDELVQRRATFAMAAAHELRSPLTALIGFAEIFDMDRDNLTSTQVEAVSIIHQNATYLEELVNDILDLTSNSFGELTLDLETTDVSGPIEEVVESLRAGIEDRGQSLKLSLDSDLPEIEVDTRRLRQIVQNLVQNAHMHCPAGTEIIVSAEVRDDDIVIGVEDDGEGLPFDPPEQAFSSFSHAGTIDFSEMTGAGIGLTITKRLTELHRGRISVDSAQGRGSSFEIRLPIDRAGTFTEVPPGPA